MIRHRPATGFGLAAVAALALAGPAAAADPVPFKGRLDGLVTRTPLNPTTLKVDIAAAGNATQLGTFKVTVPHLVNIPATGPRTAAGKYEFVAANGDKLVATFTGVSGPSATPGVFLITEVAAFSPTESTGRFAGATGGFRAERLYNPTTGVTTGAFAGTISAGR